MFEAARKTPICRSVNSQFRSGNAIEGGHGFFQGQGIAYPRGFVAGVHGELCKADVRRGDADLGEADVAQGGAAGDVRPVGRQFCA